MTKTLIDYLKERQRQIREVAEKNADALGRIAGLEEAISIASQLPREIPVIGLDDVIDRLTKHYKYLASPLSDSEKVLIQDVLTILQFPQREPQPAGEIQVDVDVLENDIAQAEAQLKSLCNSGGRTWSLSIPVRSYDTDVVYANVIRHAKTLLAHAKAQPVLESVSLKDQGCVYCNPIKRREVLGDPSEAVTMKATTSIEVESEP
jgi:hypothetical protein